ncbi:MAG: monofunctional biosynthetic peptidoglycan transglycosylase [Paracoccaceae bacterium]
MARRGRARGRLRALLRAVRRVLVWALVGVLGWVILYAFVDPPSTLTIEAERWRLGSVRRAGVELSALSPEVRLVFPAAEDARFCAHPGIDLEAVREAVAEAGRLRGASTLTQQVAKNAFLWQGRGWVRKGLEAGFAVLIEFLWPKRRILETYLSIAEMGEGVFGLGAAAEAHFGKPAAELTTREAALIAAALPSPRTRDPARPSAWLRGRAAAIEAGARTLAADGRGACLL